MLNHNRSDIIENPPASLFSVRSAQQQAAEVQHQTWAGACRPRPWPPPLTPQWGRSWSSKWSWESVCLINMKMTLLVNRGGHAVVLHMGMRIWNIYCSHIKIHLGDEDDGDNDDEYCFFQSYQQDQRSKRSSVMELNSAGGYYNPEKVNLLQWGYFLCLCEIERIEIYRQFDVFRRYSSKVKASRNQASGQKSSLITPQYLDWAQHESWNTSLKLLPVL